MALQDQRWVETRNFHFGILMLIVKFSQQCDIFGLNLCVWKFGENVTEHIGGTVAAIPTAKQVISFCRYKDQLESCFEPKTYGCSDNVVYLSTMATTRGTIKYVCMENPEDYIAYDSCWTEPSVQNQTTGCYLQYAAEVQHVLSVSDRHPPADIAFALCRIMQQSRVCMAEIVRDRCSDSASVVIERLMEIAFEDMAVSLNCAAGRTYALSQMKRSSSNDKLPSTRNLTTSATSSVSPSIIVHVCMYITILIMLK